MTEKQMMSKECAANAIEQNTQVRRLNPAVDIYETDEALVVRADMPGVAEEDLRVEIEQGVLSLEGSYPDGENGRVDYARQFRLSDRIEAETAEAGLKDGVLTLRLPKSEAAKPKRIAVKTLH